MAERAGDAGPGGGGHDRDLWVSSLGTDALTEAVGLVAAAFPAAWLGLFTAEAQALETGTAYLRIVGPTYGFFGLGLCLYFASQGAGRLFWPLVAGLLRMMVAIGGGWLALHLTGSLSALFAALALGMLLYGISLTVAIARGVWFR